MWLLHEKVAREIELARRNFAPTAAQLAEFASRRASSSAGGMPSILTIAGSEAEIVVDGVLTPRPDYFLCNYGPGNTAYEDIIAAIALAESDANVKRITFAISSPGGMSSGLYETVQRIEQAKKPTLARASCALSAAYGIAAACGRIEAANPASEFGCIGTAIMFEFYAAIEEITLTNTDSPEKRPDPRTPEGKASIVRYLDAINEWYVAGIARGRAAAGKAVTPEDVSAGFGRGATLLAPAARKAGMIDGIASARAQAGGGSGARAQSTPEPGASEQPPVAGKEADTMNKKLIAQLLGLSADASDEALEAGVVALAEARKNADAALATEQGKTAAQAAIVARFETALGVAGDAAFGALDGLLESKKQLGEANAKLADQAKAVEATERAALVEQGKAAGKLTPALITLYADKPLGELQGYLAVAPVVVPTALTQPSTTTPPTGAELTHNGKTYAAMSNAEREALYRDDEDLFNQMRGQSQKKR